MPDGRLGASLVEEEFGQKSTAKETWNHLVRVVAAAVDAAVPARIEKPEGHRRVVEASEHSDRDSDRDVESSEGD
ncbi:MAG: hypothetical protein U0872_06025 [Planctomycetaceae bacterium]